MKRAWWFPVVLAVAAGLWVYTRLAPDAPRPAGHGHRPAAHGGTLVTLGDDEFHVEAVTEAGGTVWLYTLGRDETRVIDVPAEDLAAHVVPVGEWVAYPVVLRSAPQPGDPLGRTSRFRGELPAACAGRPVTVTVPNVRIDDRRYRVVFATHGTAHGPEMPAKVVDAEEGDLYLVPGGKYSAADISANGRQTASAKFHGFRAEHDFMPEPGNRICPVTRTKANPKCSWIIGGQEYWFCCPPCVDEFVRLAKEQPAEVRDAADYVR